MSERDSTKGRSVLEMSAEEAREFFLKQESYCSIDLPPYFDFDSILNETSNCLQDQNLHDICQSGAKPAHFEGVNHVLLSNKDGMHAWRPLEIIHPVLYVDLVNAITDPNHWNLILQRFSRFRGESNVECMSIPVASSSGLKDKEEQILVWWREIEQRSLELALEFDVLAHTDITDCYGQIYTHSIAWALHGKDEAKRDRRSQSLVGNRIDRCIQGMRYGQTNGIPQGSVLMDFIAEMVLGYADLCLSNRLQNIEQEYRILRYRDDYRIFTKSKRGAEEILKTLTETLGGLGLKINSAKTSISENIIQSSIKEDKLAWLFRNHDEDNLKRYLMILHDHARRYPNSGSLLRGLVEFRKKLDKTKAYPNPRVLVSIVVDIAYGSPRTYPICAAIISRLLKFFQSSSEKQEILEKILRKFARIPNTGYMEVWLQRIAMPLGIKRDWSELLCRIAEGENKCLWKNDWIRQEFIEECGLNKSIVDEEKKHEINEEISPQEYELFLQRY